MQIKWVHIIGIAGVTTSALALEFKRNGWKVTGSDSDVYSPTDKLLNENEIEFFPEYSYTNLISKDGTFPNLVVMGSSKSIKNKEYLFALKKGLKIESYPEILSEFVEVKGNSIVVAGTFGKTSVTMMLIYTLQKLGNNVSFMVGGFSESINSTLKFKDVSTSISVIEGDEYITSRIDRKSKFFHYNPNILILNSIEWDHTDVFKTKEEYIENFRNFVKKIPKNGKIFAAKTENIEYVLNSADCEIVYFEDKKYDLNSNFIGEFNKINASRVVQILMTIGYDLEKIVEIMNEFRGIKRRLEVRFKNENTVIIDDFGSSPAKAQKTILSLKKEFPGKKLVVIFEPNEGARTSESLEMYDNLFEDVDVLILPKFREIQNRINEVELSKRIKQTFKGELLLSNNLSEDIYNNNSEESVVAFLGSHEFETEIQKIIQKLT